MKIRMKVSISGLDFALKPNDETDRFSDAECARLIEAGAAEEVQPEKEPEPKGPLL